MIRRIRVKLVTLGFCLASYISPKLNTQLRFLEQTKHTVNLDNPKTFSEKISWLKLYRYARDPLVKKCADKLRVRSYVEEKGLQFILNDLYGVYRDPEEINWAKLPDRFVLKWNFGSTYNYICNDKTKLNQDLVLRQLQKWKRKRFWALYAELQYRNVKKRILCERYLDTAPDTPLLDYKFYCFHGRPLAVLVIARPEHGEKAAVFMSPEWELISDVPTRYKESLIPKKPTCLAEMLRVAEILSAPFPFVRVDLYDHDNRVIFGEMTFTPAAGLFPSETRIDGKDMGEYINLSL